MYEPFFGMERRPFSATPDPGCFFSSQDLQAVLDDLTVCVERGQGIGILTAAAGIGKTLLCQRLAASLRQRDESSSQFECVYLSNSNYPTRRSLLQAILFEMGDEYSRRDEPELRIDLRSRLLSLRPQREALVLIVDEAHLFPDDLLEELRTLSDLADNGSSLVRIVLSGQHELEERLTDRSFDALNQRISKHVFAEPLTISESADYIQHRLAWAGSDIESVFSEEATGVITRASGGVPRCLNQLSDHSLLLAFASDQKPVSEDTVREALEDLKQLPLHWNDVSDGTEVVGYVEDEDEETTEAFDGEVDEAPIDAEREAALLQLASENDAASSVGVNDESSADSEDVDSDDQSGIVESLQSGASASLAATGSAHAPALDGGFEFDFSDSKDDRSAVEPETESGETEHAQVSPVAQDETVASVIVEHAAESELDDHDETIIQAIPAAPQETIFEVRPDSGNEQVGTCADTGISFQITSNGSELDDFGSPEESNRDTVETAAINEGDGAESVAEEEFNSDFAAETASEDGAEVDSGVIEFSFSADSEHEDVSTSCEAADCADESAATLVEEPVASEQLEPAEQNGDAEKRTISAAEITLALFGQDSVLPEHKCDVMLPESVEAESEESIVAELQTSAEEAVTDALPTLEAAKTEDEISCEEEPDVINQVVQDKSGCEEEFVYDPYAALQEPDGAGIVWDVANFSKHAATTEVAELLDEAGASVEAASDEPAEEIEFSEPVETVENFVEPSAAEETSQDSSGSPPPIAESCDDDSVAEFKGGLVLDDGFEDQQTEEPASALNRAVEESAAEALRDETPEITQLDVSEPVTSEETIEAVDPPETVVWESDQDKAEACENDVANEQAEIPVSNDYQEDDCEEATSFAHDEHNKVHGGHDIVQPVEERPLQPDRLVDAVLPLLAELDEDLRPVTRPGMTSRSVLDIEAELIQTIQHGSDELEDQIGATMLDICLDTHSALQDSAAAIRNAEAAELDSLNDFDDATDELLSEPFDIVQPEPRRHDESSGYELDPQFRKLAANSADAEITSEEPPKPTEKPFGKLFSELRRRKS
jgi:type II secretory pathway predicted ATPase ExeA